MIFRKILIFLILNLCIISNVFSFDLYSFIGKNVNVCTVDKCYTGKVDDVITIEVCKQKDLSGNCIYKEYRDILFLREFNGNIMSLNENSINKLEEIK